MYGILNTGAISTDAALTRLPLAVYARFKSVNLKKYYKQKIQFWWGPLVDGDKGHKWIQLLSGLHNITCKRGVRLN